ncbi:sterol desaturase family protein [Microbulbifer spongiae]|uniref:Sterol desaturase family protein n=1 Tax=Microbulbifer spongiae TaxID=2944933 RepID=A0ABY9EDP2_9GAMM|nr:sterol desaturase family protein [Microbulbifer sp. MI-G]WKD51148.1 sterol desaturase family protein [Microbulbifer sp. MI-G]
MDWLFTRFSEDELYYLEAWIGEWLFYVAMAIFALELLRQAWKKRVNWNLLGDAVTNFVTLVAFLGIALLFFGVYVATLYWFYENMSIIQLPNKLWVMGLAIILADFIYYWEHRFMHRVGFGWATHTVHHSSPYFNISVAFRFGPADGILPLFFHLPMAMLGFNPWMILFAETMVQLYQTALHTELVKKLPRWFEAVFNTPSHHRVHHGSNPQYIDKNYAGILIIWDKLFGSFAPEKKTVVYGLTKPIASINPIKVFFHGYWRMLIDMVRSKNVGEAIGYFVMPPGWKPDRVKARAENLKPPVATESGR